MAYLSDGLDVVRRDPVPTMGDRAAPLTTPIDVGVATAVASVMALTALGRQPLSWD